MQRALLEARASSDDNSMPGAETAEVLLPYLPESASQARRFLRKTLTEWGLVELIDAAELVACELVTNAAKTGCRRQMTVTIRRVSQLIVRISVRDGSRALPVLIQASPDEECHRGLALVDRLTAGRWGASVEPLGKVVHADLAMPKPVPQ
ncbi:ATP-binding protein [Kitasatospora sp. NPDC058190]|uniref:ATP-binding protein n=1 Tax=Kitasatospora sp. NPDC058190 TaxID=3346371 RepID=UPI0036D9F42B